MRHVSRRTFGAAVLALTTLMPGALEARQQSFPRLQAPIRSAIQRRIPKGARAGAQPFVRTELFFGTAKSNGVVTEAEFRKFVDEQVTPRFPDGLTLLKGDGQFRGDDRITIKEQSFVLILLYPYDSFTKSSQKIQRIRGLYKDQFDQESVLRIDDPYTVWVSF
jgi:Protein of unknown function (DUF3574)